LQAKELPAGAERERLYRESFRLELSAYELVRGLKSPAASYLRHNLLANITFLLEISRRFAEAVEFWSNAFERYLAADSQSFAAAFDMRLGVLLFKAGRADEALETLLRAQALCRAEGDLFYTERACLALGYAAFHSGAHEQALAAFSDGLRIAVRLRDDPAYQAHLAGVLWSLAAGADAAAFGQAVTAAAGGPPAGPGLAALVTEVKAGHDPATALQRAEVAIPPPSPKMPSYIPSIDLEGAPDRDLNRYLVFGSGRLRGSA
jgi:tetratricopeptide (TPR) repeat protein